MPITRPQLETILVRANRAKLAYARLSVATDGANPDLEGPIAAALRSLRIFPADLASPSTEDLAAVGPEGMGQLVDVAGLEVLEAVLGNRASPDQMADTDNRQEHGKFYDLLEKTVARKQARCERLYGYGARPTTVSDFDLGFGERGCWGW